MSLKNKVKKDLENNLETDLSFDTSKLPSNDHVHSKNAGVVVRRCVFGTLIATLVGVIIIPAAIVFIRPTSSVKEIHKNYSAREIKVISDNSFKKLNNITYPSEEYQKQLFSSEEIESYLNYTYQIYSNYSFNHQNQSLSPLTLYGLLMGSAKAISNEEISGKYTSLLGLDEAERIAFYQKLFKANYFSNEEGKVILHNGAFLTNSFDYNQEYISYLTKVFSEAFQMDFKKNEDVNNMLSWVNQAIEENDYIKRGDLNITTNTVMYLFSTMNFNQKWSSKFSKDKTYKDNFYGLDKTNTTKFMRHTFVNDYYDYGEYISVSDYYRNGYKVTYLVPKQHNQNIYDLTSGVNIFKEDVSKKVTGEYGSMIIDLSVPRFASDSTLDLKDTFVNLGMGDIFNETKKVYNNAFTNLDENICIYMDEIKQMNKVEFNEDGTVIKSISIGGASAKSAAPNKTLEVKLDQPFIYIIKNENDIPIHVGHIDNL